MKTLYSLIVLGAAILVACPEENERLESGAPCDSSPAEEETVFCRAKVTLIDRANNQDSYYCGDLEDPNDCCPTGFTFAGYPAQSEDAVCCLEDDPGSPGCRAVVEILAAPGAQGMVCGDSADPSSCCPLGFQMVGYSANNRDAVVCLEQSVGERSRQVLEVLDLHENHDTTKCADLPDPQGCCIGGFTFVGYSAFNADSVVCLQD